MTDKLDEILDKLWCEPYTDGSIDVKGVPEAKQAIQQLIEEAIQDYQTKYEQKHIASAVQVARIDQAEYDYWQYRPISEEENFVEAMQEIKGYILDDLNKENKE